jgi:hypothetical protein
MMMPVRVQTKAISANDSGSFPDWLALACIAPALPAGVLILFRRIWRDTMPTTKTPRTPTRQEIFEDEQEERRAVWVQEVDRVNVLQRYGSFEERNRSMWAKVLITTARAYICGEPIGTQLIGFDDLRRACAPFGRTMRSKGYDGGNGLLADTWKEIKRFFVDCGIIEERAGWRWIITINGLHALRLVEKYTQSHTGRQVRLPDAECPTFLKDCHPKLWSPPVPKARIAPPEKLPYPHER